MFQTITVAYWGVHHEDKLGIKHGDKFNYSLEKLNELINKAIENKLNVMTRRGKETLYLWIDNDRFRQM